MSMRTTHRFVGGKEGRASLINFESLRKGDYFFMNEPNGDIFRDPAGNVIFRANTKPIKTAMVAPGNYIVDAKQIC